jgi:hypothetical protein
MENEIEGGHIYLTCVDAISASSEVILGPKKLKPSTRGTIQDLCAERGRTERKDGIDPGSWSW